jgi:hypothetical protein
MFKNLLLLILFSSTIYGNSKSSSILLNSSPLELPNWYESSWFGNYFEVSRFWAYHTDLGWLYVPDSDHENFWIHHSELRWLWTSSSVYPWLYLDGIQTWVYYRNQFDFYKASTNSWCTLEDLKEEMASDSYKWYDATKWGVEGRGYEDQHRLNYFDRFPAKAKEMVTPSVWDYSRHSSGMAVRFKTNASEIHARWKLTSDRLGMAHMPPSGVSGLDLYARDSNGKWLWAAATRPSNKEMETKLLFGIAKGIHEYLLYLPLYNGIESLSIGIPNGATFEGLTPHKTKPLVFYGTSITQGACASRPGITHIAILGRRLNKPTINLGFSGSGHMDEAVGKLMVELDASCYVIDCLPNMDKAMVETRCVPLVKLIRKGRPNTPIVLVEDRRYTNSWLTPYKSKFHDENHAALNKAYDLLLADGVQQLYYLPGDDLLGQDTEGTTDGSHPNDLGFIRQADAFEPVLIEALGI